MKIVVQTQHRENYAAHDGFTGDYHWKCKGGETYILEGVTVEQAQDHMIWDLLKDHIAHFDDYSEEIVRGMYLEDDCEPNSNFHEEWESPVILMLRDDNTFAAKRITNPEYTGEWGEYVQKRETWIQREGVRDDYTLIYERNDGVLCDWRGEVLEEAA